MTENAGRSFVAYFDDGKTPFVMNFDAQSLDGDNQEEVRARDVENLKVESCLVRKLSVGAHRWIRKN
jgi:hypothetical protein